MHELNQNTPALFDINLSAFTVLIGICNELLAIEHVSFTNIIILYCSFNFLVKRIQYKFRPKRKKNKLDETMARTKTTPQHSPTQRNLRTRTPTSSQPPPQANPESPDVCAVNGVSYFSNDSNNSATNSHRNETNRSRSVRESTMPDESESSNDVNNQSNTESNESDNSSNHEDNNRTDRTANNTVIQRTPATRSRKQNNKISKIFKEIARLQMSTSLLIPKLSFQR